MLKVEGLDMQEGRCTPIECTNRLARCPDGHPLRFLKHTLMTLCGSVDANLLKMA